MKRLVKSGELSLTWPNYLGYTTDEITARLKQLENEGKSLPDAFATVLFENNNLAAKQLRQHMQANLEFIDDKIESLTK